MESWIFYAILSAIFAGLYSFCLKIVAEKGYSAAEATFYASVVGSVIGISYFIFFDVDFSNWRIVSSFTLISVFVYYVALITRIESLKNIHTTIYFPIYKTLGPIFATVIGIYYFYDNLTTYEMIGIALGIVVPLLLISKSEDKIQKNLKKGLILVFIGSVLTVINSIISKYIAQNDLNYQLHIVLIPMFFACLSLINMMHEKKKEKEFVRNGIKKLVIPLGVTQFCGFLFSILAFRDGDFSVVFTINAFSILIPIVLSVWFFKEHMNFRKGFIIALSIVSIIFFAF